MHSTTTQPTSVDDLRARHLKTADLYRREAEAIKRQWWATKARQSWTHEQNERKWSQSAEARKARSRLEWAEEYEGYARAQGAKAAR